MTAGKVEISASKAEREAASMLQIGGQKKNKGKKRKETTEQYEEFTIDLGIIKKFATLGITAPVSSDDLDKCQKLVEEKKAWYEENGGAKLK